MTILLPIFQILISLMNFLEYLLIAYIILGWLVFFGIIKDRSGTLFKIYIFLISKLEPTLAQIRRILPNVAGLDFSPLVIFVALHFAKVLLAKLFLFLVNA